LPQLSGNISYGTGKYGKSAFFDNRVDVDTAPANTIYISNSNYWGALTVSVWIMPTLTNAGGQTAVSLCSSTYTTATIQIDIYPETRSLTVYLAMPSPWTLTLNSPQSSLSTNVWHHVAVTISSSWDASLYLNGAQVARGTGSGSPQTAWINRWRLGGSGDWGIRGFRGEIDEFRVYQQSLSTTDIASLYSSIDVPGVSMVVRATLKHVLTLGFIMVCMANTSRITF
jgi:hypothetical protein